MAIHAGLVAQAKADFIRGVHQPGDVYKVALYGPLATLNVFTSAYTPAGEVSGPGYVKGGAALSGYRCELHGTTAALGWADVTWKNATLAACGALIYNATRGGRALVVVDFGREIASTNGPWVLTMPPLDAESALVRIT